MTSALEQLREKAVEACHELAKRFRKAGLDQDDRGNYVEGGRWACKAIGATSCGEVIAALPIAITEPVPDTALREPDEEEIARAVWAIQLGISANVAWSVNVGAALRRFVDARAGRAALREEE